MNRLFLAIMTSIVAISASAQQDLINDFLTKMGEESMVIIRQDYQLIDDEDNVKNAHDKDYWKRTYALGILVGDDRYMITDESVKPWNKDGLSRKDRFQPSVSSTAFRPLKAIEFDEIEFESDELDEIQENRLFTFTGSEIPGVSVISPSRSRQVYLIIAESQIPISENNESAEFKVRIIPESFSFSNHKNIYDLKTELSKTTFGGFAVTPVRLRPGLIDFCVVGMLQKVGGVWKLISVGEGTLIHQSGPTEEYNLENLVGLITNSMEYGINSFIGSIGVNSGL